MEKQDYQTLGYKSEFSSMGKGDKNYDRGSRAELMARNRKLGIGFHCYEKALMVECCQSFLESCVHRNARLSRTLKQTIE